MIEKMKSFFPISVANQPLLRYDCCPLVDRIFCPDLHDHYRTFSPVNLKVGMKPIEFSNIYITSKIQDKLITSTKPSIMATIESQKLLVDNNTIYLCYILRY